MRKSNVKSSRPTLNDIALRAGVSISTASLVLTDKAHPKRFSTEVVERIRQVAAELDYTPNLLVHSLQQGRTHNLVFYNAFRKRGLHDMYMDRLSMALQLAGGRHGFDILVHCVFNRSVEETYHQINGGLCDGVIFFAPMMNDPLLPYLRNSRLPAVIINAVDYEGALSYIKEDHIDGMSQIVDALMRLGHRRIAAMEGISANNSDSELRISMLRHLLVSRGIPMYERWILHIEENDESLESAIRCLMTGAIPPTALFCWNDHLAYQVLSVCERLGIDLPGQLSLIGYDGVRWPVMSRHVVASVHVDIEKVAEEAVSVIEQLISGEISAPVGRILGVKLDYGTTLGKAPSE